MAAAKGAHLAALASAGGHVGYAGSYAGGSPYYASAAPAAHYIAAPGVGYDGTPLDTPEVAAAKAAHFAAFSEAAARNGAHYRKRRSVGAYYGGYSGPQHIPVITDRGVPLDTPEVQAAKAYHAQAFVQAAQKAALSGPGESGGEYERKWYGPIHIPVIGPNGVPLEPQEVQQARAAHLSALSGGHGSLYASPVAAYSPYYGSAYPQAHIGPNGQPLDTPEVQAAKAAHFAAYSRAYAHAY